MPATYTFEEPHKVLGDVEIFQSHDAVASGSSDGGLAHCWRLWDGSIAMSRHLERNHGDLTGQTILELGAGTGSGPGLDSAREGSLSVSL